MRERLNLDLLITVTIRNLIKNEGAYMYMYLLKCIQPYSFFRIHQAISNLIMDHLHVQKINHKLS